MATSAISLKFRERPRCSDLPEELMQKTNRRDFIKIAASLSAAVAAGDAKPLYAESDTPAGTVRAWRTSPLEKFQPVQASPQWESGEELSASAIYLDPGTVKQEILGFGGAFTD